MYFLGLHIIDVAVVVFYLLVTLYIGKRVAKSIKDQNDFFLAGRKLGKAFQFFLNFGGMTDANGAAAISSMVFRNGVAGVWIGFQTLFMTPYYWFMNCWFRRVRLMTMGELFEDRFGGKSLATLYAIFNIGLATGFIGWGYLVSYKTMEAITVKPAVVYSIAEKQMVDGYNEFQQLKTEYQAGTLPVEKRQRYESLQSLNNKGQLRSYISYINPIMFYLIYGLVVGIYVILGGFAAAAITDALQGLLIIFFSLMMIPIGLIKLGGFSGLHANVPGYMFRLFGSVSVGEYTWFSILAILFTSWVQIHAGYGNMATAGSAKDEFAARFGAVAGGFSKRFMIIGWTLCGLIAYALYADRISDPDTSWGFLSNNLLATGAVGLMLAGILAANMSTLDASCIHISGLFVRNIYIHIVKNKSDKHYVLVGRLSIAVILGLGIFVAMYATGVIALLKYLIAIGVTFGAPILLMFFWRRLTKTAVIIEVFVCMLVICVIPWVVTAIPSLRTSQALTQMSEERVVTVEQTATEKDVQEKLASAAGEKIMKTHTIESKSLFFDSLAHTDPYDMDSPLEGVGRFNVEVFLTSKLGVDVRSMTPAGLLATHFIFDGILPFVLLFPLSLITKRTDKNRLDRFYVKMKTPIQPTPEADAAEVEKSFADPRRFDDQKLLPGSNWEMCKWTRQDGVGFAICWFIVAAILGIFYLLLNLGR